MQTRQEKCRLSNNFENYACTTLECLEFGLVIIQYTRLRKFYTDFLFHILSFRFSICCFFAIADVIDLLYKLSCVLHLDKLLMRFWFNNIDLDQVN